MKKYSVLFPLVSTGLRRGVPGNRCETIFRNTAITGLALIICLSVSLPTRAQDRPTAFGSDSDLSAMNKKEYLRVAGLYKDATGAKRKEYRNQLIALTIAQTDLNFLSYQKRSDIVRRFLGR